MPAVSAKAKRNRHEYHQGWRARNPGKTREYWLKRYGITEAEYNALLLKQGGRCALCEKRPADEPRGVLNVDHCHTTMRVRGLLCMKHNNGLGALGDDEAGLLAALAYVRGS